MQLANVKVRGFKSIFLLSRIPMTMSDNTIKLDQFLKFVGVAPTGGMAKLMIQNGDILVNGVVETRRGRKLVSGDRVTVGSETFDVELNNS